MIFTCGAGLSDVSAYGSKQHYLLRECFWLIVITEEWTMRKTPKSPGEKIVDMCICNALVLQRIVENTGQSFLDIFRLLMGITLFGPIGADVRHSP